jgi:hypothetical protein
MPNLGYFVVGLGLLAVYLVAMAAVPFGAAGTFAAPMFWYYAGDQSLLQPDASFRRLGSIPQFVGWRAAGGSRPSLAVSALFRRSFAEGNPGLLSAAHVPAQDVGGTDD